MRTTESLSSGIIPIIGCVFFELTAQGYKETDRSRHFPLLASDQLTKFMNLSLQEGQSKTLKAFREWLCSSMRKDHD